MVTIEFYHLFIDTKFLEEITKDFEEILEPIKDNRISYKLFTNRNSRKL